MKVQHFCNTIRAMRVFRTAIFVLKITVNKVMKNIKANNNKDSLLLFAFTFFIILLTAICNQTTYFNKT